MKKIILLITLSLAFGHKNHQYSHGSIGQNNYNHSHKHNSHNHMHANHHHNNSYHSKHIHWGNLISVYLVDEHPWSSRSKVWYWKSKYEEGITDLKLLYDDYEELLRQYDDLLEQNDELERALVKTLNGDK